MSIDDQTLTDLIEAVIDARERERGWHTLLGIVESFDASRKSVNVQPTTLERRPDGTEQAIPLLVNVPYEFPRAGGGPGFVIEWPVAPGDVVEVRILRHAYDQWLLKGGHGVSERFNVRYDLGQAVASPGPRTFTNTDPLTSTTDLVIRAVDGSVSISLKPGGVVEIEGATEIRLGAGATDFVALSTLVLTELQAIKTAFDTHIHTTPAGPSGVPTIPMPAPSSVAAAKTKAE